MSLKLMTFNEAIFTGFPLHAQRIFELIHARWAYGDFDAHVSGPIWTPRSALLSSFVWATTDEGHEYWKALFDGAHLTSFRSHNHDVEHSHAN